MAPYSQINKPDCIGKIKIKSCVRYYWTCGRLAKAEIFKNTYAIYDISTLIVEALYYHKSNQHGWNAANAHSHTHLMKGEKFNPFELDTIA